MYALPEEEKVKPDPKKYAAAKKRLQHGLRKIIADAEQLGRDIAWWNQNRTDAPPFDRGGDLSTAALAKRCLALVEGNQPIPSGLWQRLNEQIRTNAEG